MFLGIPGPIILILGILLLLPLLGVWISAILRAVRGRKLLADFDRMERDRDYRQKWMAKHGHHRAK